MKYEIRDFGGKNRFAMLPIAINRPEHLSGSEKQVSWANDILDSVAAFWAEANNLYALRLPEGVDVADPRLESALDGWTAKFQSQFDAFFAHTDAKYYIERLKGFNGNWGKDRLQIIITTR